MDGNRFFFVTSGLDGATRAAARSGGGRLPMAVSATRDVLRMWASRSRQRRALARLDDRLLEDIGLRPDAAGRESKKPFWRA